MPLRLRGACQADLEVALDAAEAAGRTTVLAGWSGGARAVLAVADTVKPTSAEAVDALRRLGLRPVLLTGDNPRAAAAVAAEVGIAAEDVIARRTLSTIEGNLFWAFAYTVAALPVAALAPAAVTSA